MKLGFHISIAGGFRKVVPRAIELECSTIQLFSRNPRGWKYKPLQKEDIAFFRQAIEKERISPVFVHMPYLINLASPKTELFQLSLKALTEGLRRNEMIGAQFLIMHFGSSKNRTEGIQRMVDGINRALNEIRNNVVLLIENTAGSGNELGYKFRDMKDLFDSVNDKKRIGAVLDTAHAFQAGYDLRTEKGIEQIVEEIENLMGLHKVHLIHLNDSKTECGSRSDRHWHIGKGKIGNGMRYIINHPLLNDKPFIMETPRKTVKDDLMNLKRVRKFLEKKC